MLPLGRALHALFMTYRAEDNESHYRKLMALLDHFGGDIPPSQLEDLYNGAVNFCIRKINTGSPHYRQELLLAYQKLEENGLIKTQGNIAALHLKNMILLAARLENFDYAEALMARYGSGRGKLLAAHQVAYNHGVISFYKKDFKAAERWFHRVSGDLKDVFSQLDARTYLMRIYYETGNDRGMESLAHSFRVYLDRLRSLPKNRKENYQTFIKIFRRLYNLPPMDQRRIQRLREEVESSVRFAAKDWFLEKLDGMVGK